METIDDLITTTTDTRILKRALCIKMLQSGLVPHAISLLLNVSEQYVSKWKGLYESEGACGLQLGYQGRTAYLKAEDRGAILAWMGAHPTLTLEEVRDYVETEYGVTYQSKQSYYSLFEEAEMSYHRSELVNPKRDEAQIEQKRAEIKKKWKRIGQT